MVDSQEAGFASEEKKWGSSGSVRLRTSAPPYVCQGLPEKVHKDHCVHEIFPSGMAMGFGIRGGPVQIGGILMN